MHKLIGNEEIMEITFVNNEDNIINVKTKHLFTYNINIISNELISKDKTSI